MDAAFATFVVHRPEGALLGWGTRFPDGVVVVHWRDGGVEVFGEPPTVELLRATAAEPELVLRWHDTPSPGGAGTSLAADEEAP